MNNCSFTGRLINDVEIRKGTSGNGDYTIGKFTIAVGTKRKKEGSKYYEDQLVTFNARNQGAEFIAKYFKKGSVIEIANAEYTSRKVEKDGRTMYFHEFNITPKTSVDFPMRDFANKDGGNQDNSNDSYASNDSGTSGGDPFSGGSVPDLNDDDLPF